MKRHQMSTEPSSLSSARDNPIHSTIEENADLVEKARARVDHRLLSRLMPEASTQLGREAELTELEAGFEYRRQILLLAVQSKVQAVEEACNHLLLTGKSEIRRERHEFFADQLSRLARSMHGYAEDFNAEIDLRLDEITTRYKSEIIRKKEEQRLCRQVEGFHQVLDEMATEFQQIINEGVHTDNSSPTDNRTI